MNRKKGIRGVLFLKKIAFKLSHNFIFQGKIIHNFLDFNFR